MEIIKHTPLYRDVMVEYVDTHGSYFTGNINPFSYIYIDVQYMYDMV